MVADGKNKSLPLGPLRVQIKLTDDNHRRSWKAHTERPVAVTTLCAKAQRGGADGKKRDGERHQILCRNQEAQTQRRDNARIG